ncbi:MAG: Ig-like domain-containing protein, partial [Bacteroidales bacterium]|nr:Ig-like domain-containing protein [Bacteroidales bacterium]
MKKIKYIISIFAVAVMASCVKEIQAPIIPVRTVTIDQGDQALSVGQSVKLTASVQPVNATDRDLKWSSSNEDIAMVSAGGKVKALSVGEVAITAVAGGVSDLITIKVVAKLVPVTGVSIAPSSTSLKIGETQLLKAEITPSDATNTSVKWTSSNDRVASVEKGLITGLKPGTATITVTTNDGDKTAECAVTVEDEPLPVATLDADNVSPVSAVLNGKVIAAEVSPGIMVGFQYAETPSDLPFNSTTLEAAISNSEYNFSAGISGLEPGTTYCFRSVIRLNDEENYGEIKTFVTQSPESLFSYIEIPESDIKQTSVVLKVATALSNVLYESISYGFMWGTEESALNNTLPANLVSEGIIQATLTDLSYETKYYYKAFVIIDGLKLDSPQWDVTTLPFIMESVDLGLSVKWANANLGAEEPEEWGDYYAWGEVETYYSSLDPLIWKPGRETGHERSSYKWAVLVGDDYRYTKYCLNNTWFSYWGGTGAPDNKSTLDLEDDPAHVILGGDWRMPTKDEFTELLDNCTL